jgi:hypothetical protein
LSEGAHDQKKKKKGAHDKKESCREGTQRLRTKECKRGVQATGDCKASLQTNVLIALYQIYMLGKTSYFPGIKNANNRFRLLVVHVHRNRF